MISYITYLNRPFSLPMNQEWLPFEDSQKLGTMYYDSYVFLILLSTQQILMKSLLVHFIHFEENEDSGLRFLILFEGTSNPNFNQALTCL